MSVFFNDLTDDELDIVVEKKRAMINHLSREANRFEGMKKAYLGELLEVRREQLRRAKEAKA